MKHLLHEHELLPLLLCQLVIFRLVLPLAIFALLAISLFATIKLRVDQLLQLFFGDLERVGVLFILLL